MVSKWVCLMSSGILDQYIQVVMELSNLFFCIFSMWDSQGVKSVFVLLQNLWPNHYYCCYVFFNDIGIIHSKSSLSPLLLLWVVLQECLCNIIALPVVLKSNTSIIIITSLRTIWTLHQDYNDYHDATATTKSVVSALQ